MAYDRYQDPPDGKLKIMTVNCCSLRSTGKRLEFASLLHEHQPDIVCGTESHLENGITTSEVFPKGFDIFRKDRSLGGGGVFVAVSDKYVACKVDALETNCEAIWAKLEVTGSKPLRPPDTNTFNIQQLDEALRKIPQPKETLLNVIVTGDFNVPDIDWSNLIIKGNPQYGRELNELMKDTLQDNNLTQCNHKPTRYDNILDLVCTTNPDLITSITTAGGMSDHEIVISIVDMKAKTTKKKPRRVYIYKNGNIKNIREDLITFRRELEKDMTISVDEMYNNFVEVIRTSTEKHIPHKTLSGRWDAPWVNRNIKRLIRIKKRRYDKAKQSGTPEDWETFKEFRRFVKHERIKSHDEYIKGILDTDGKDNGFKISKEFWSYVRSKRRDMTGIPVLKVDGKEITTGREKAEALSGQYDSIFTNEDLTDISCLLTPPAPRIKELTIDVNGVQKLLKNLDHKKANGPDQISTFILKECAEEIAPILTNIFTTSLATGTTPSLWRTANIVAIFKKGSRMSTHLWRMRNTGAYHPSPHYESQ